MIGIAVLCCWLQHVQPTTSKTCQPKVRKIIVPCSETIISKECATPKKLEYNENKDFNKFYKRKDV